MRFLRFLKQLLIDLLLSGIAGVLLLLAFKELLRRPEQGAGLLDDLLPPGARLPAAFLIIAAVLAVLWFSARSLGGPRGTMVGITIWLSRLGLSWSVVALTLFLGVALYGICTRNLSDLNWGFALGYLVLTLLVLSVSAVMRRRVIGRPGTP